MEDKWPVLCTSKTIIIKVLIKRKNLVHRVCSKGITRARAHTHTGTQEYTDYTKINTQLKQTDRLEAEEDTSAEREIR